MFLINDDCFSDANKLNTKLFAAFSDNLLYITFFKTTTRINEQVQHELDK